MTHDDVRQLIDTHMEEECELADAGDVEALENQVLFLSDQVAAQADQIASLNNYCNALLQALIKVAAEQGIKVRVEPA